jgi:hypothetical protein
LRRSRGQGGAEGASCITSQATASDEEGGADDPVDQVGAIRGIAVGVRMRSEG